MLVNKYILPLVVGTAVAVCMIVINHQTDWEKEGEQTIESFYDKPCVSYTVNAPAYMANMKYRTECDKYSFSYVPKNSTHAPNFGKVFWGLKIAESGFAGTALYFDWDVLPNANYKYILHNTSLLLAYDTRGITTNFFAFTHEAEDFFRRWFAHTFDARDYDIEDQTWINAELDTTNYSKVEAKRIIKGHCHSKLVNRKYCIMSMYNKTHVPWKYAIVLNVVSTFGIAYAYTMMPTKFFIFILFVESVFRSMWMCVLTDKNNAIIRQLSGVGNSLEDCMYNTRSIWNTARNKFHVPYDRMYIGNTIVETKALADRVLVSNGMNIVKCTVNASKLWLTHAYYLLIAEILAILFVVLTLHSYKLRGTLYE